MKKNILFSSAILLLFYFACGTNLAYSQNNYIYLGLQAGQSCDDLQKKESSNSFSVVKYKAELFDDDIVRCDGNFKLKHGEYTSTYAPTKDSQVKSLDIIAKIDEVSITAIQGGSPFDDVVEFVESGDYTPENIVLFSIENKSGNKVDNAKKREHLYVTITNESENVLRAFIIDNYNGSLCKTKGKDFELILDPKSISRYELCADKPLGQHKLLLITHIDNNQRTIDPYYLMSCYNEAGGGQEKVSFCYLKYNVTRR